MFSTKDQYKIFHLKKKSGKLRQIEAPNPELKAQQRELLNRMKGQSYISPFVHSFRSAHNVVTNAWGHLQAEYVLHIDASNFFPSITYQNFICRVDLKQGNNFPTAEEVKIAFCKFEEDGEERLPQGAPTSPWISNLYLSRFDSYMSRYMANIGMRYIWGKGYEGYSGYNYSRYADDITISGPDKERLWALYFMIKQHLEKRYKIILNDNKTRMMGPGQRKIVCGIVVNVKAQPKRRWRRNLRAEIHNQQVAGKPLKASTRGKIAYLNMCKNTEGIGSAKEVFMHRNRGVMEDL